MMRRCPWAESPEIMTQYHDEEWGVPVHDDVRHFEFLTLEGAQAGLSWLTILKRREGYRRAFAGFDPDVVARFDEVDVERLAQDEGIIRHRGKIRSTINNARRILEVQAEFGSFDAYLWGFTDGRIVHNGWTVMEDVPSTNPVSDALAKDLKRRGFSFVGSTTVYAHLQAAGLVNDHLATCPRFEAVMDLDTGR